MNTLKNLLRKGITIGSFCLVSGTILSAQISLSMQNKSTREVIREIEKVSDYRFFYNDNLSGLNTKISVSAQGENIRDVLEQIKSQAQITYIIKENNQIVLSALGYVSSSTQQNTRKITGIVKDQSGEPVIGANIVEKGTTNGTITDIDGQYSLEVGSNSILVVSYIGYITQEIPVGKNNTLDVLLREDTETLDEVIVIGYGTTKRKDFTGSVSSVKLENSPIALSPNLNALESLKGNVSGLDIGATNSAGGEPSMQMRGQKSISGSNDPLIVVDGVIFMGSINDINPNDIASYDVLKDATSAAAYGSRSANGVIIITTKRGKTGKPVVTFNATGSMQTWQNKPELMKGEQWLESVMARNNSSDLSWLKPQELANMEAGREINWLDASTRTGWVQDYQVAVSGAGEKMNYYLSAAYSDNQGVVIGDDYNRITALAKINTDITSWLQIGVDAAFTKSDYSGVGANIGEATQTSPYGVMYRNESEKLLEKYPYTQSSVNALWNTDKSVRDNKDIRNNFRANAYAVVKLPWVEGLSYRFNYAGNLSKNQSGDFYYEGYFVKEGAYDDETRYSPATLQSLLASANGKINNNTTDSWVIDNILNYKNTFGKHSIDLTAVATRDRKKYEMIETTGSNFAANGNTTLGINGLHKATVQKVNMDNNQRSNIGYLGRASYSYDDRYFFTGSYRRDGASVFGVNQKWGDFFAFGGAWRLSSEKFMSSISYLDDLKLKLSWGKNGNQGLDPYGTLSTINNGASGGVRYEFGGSDIIYGLNQKALGNANLGWERILEYRF
jgi:TonB-linked SusC/RagA family outer membrane protein